LLEREKSSYLTARLSEALGKLEFTDKSLSAFKTSDHSKWTALLTDKDTKLSDLEQEVVTLKYQRSQMQEAGRQAAAGKTALQDLRAEFEQFKEKNLEQSKSKAKAGLGKLDACKSVEEARALGGALLKEIDALAAAQDILGRSNARLLKQGREKEEMNRSSMTEVIRLKQLVERGKDENEALARQLKEAEQVVVAARLAGATSKKIEDALATNTREAADAEARFREELGKERSERAKVEGNLEETRLRMGGSGKAMGETKLRVEELTVKNADLMSNNGKLSDQVKVLGAENAKFKGSGGGEGGGGGLTGFSVEHLELQVKTMRNKIMCNVCNEREKQVMLTRCCHTFCKPCIDERIAGRGRNCPSCNDKFDKKEVTRVFFTG